MRWLTKDRSMSIAIYLPENWEPAKLVQWSTTLARSKGEDLELEVKIILPWQGFGDERT